MDLLEHLRLQGCNGEAAEELVERKKKSPHLTGVTIGGRWISLSPPNGVKFNEMVSSGVPPASNTDREFLMGSENGRQFAKNQAVGDYYQRECERNGGQTKGRKYISQLARYPGDPQAWVAGRGDVQKLCEQRGWGSDGLVNVKERPRDKEPPPPVQVADDLVDKAVAKELAGHKVSAKELARTREKVKDKLTPNWKK